MKKDICDFTLEELTEETAVMGEPSHRARQIFLWLYHKNAESFDVMTDLPKSFIAKLKKKFVIVRLECAEHLVSMDSTEKFLWRLKDKEYIESVVIREKKRLTVCVSTQVGCKFKCPFCASGTRGFKRNLTQSEILNQIIMAQTFLPSRITNIVFMGMGEPLDNYKNLMGAIRIINSPKGMRIGARKITVSTCGIVPAIRRLKGEGIQIELSVSLHAAYDKLRNELVPAGRKYSLKELISACREYYEGTGRVITLEYTLIRDQNDSRTDAEKLAGIAGKIKAKVNLIDCSPFVNLNCMKTPLKRKIMFKNILESKGVTVTLRKSKGTDILAACGQLAAEFKRKK